ncbi:hypothetical protein SAMN06265173_106150 [Thalassovita litoralis]|jgi:hypothetical protein|uniref:50S ribosomal protein L35 n=1 Tax=Thalassovita litoralis TaxID=1010611 RepID=A0A521CGY8_9RHOB|nr:hypothetical protein [Thalassovita litoralis]SMO58703.1 hypothetical protein SAMN06265173_106150 [Thalassovita litoralis]
MDPDTVFVMGLFIAIFSVPSMVSAWSDGHVPRVASVVAILGGAMMVWAHSQKVGGYSFDEIPDLIVKVAGKFI